MTGKSLAKWSFNFNLIYLQKMLEEEINLYNLYSELSDNQNIISTIHDGYSVINSAEYEWPQYVFNIYRDQSINKIEEIVEKIEIDEIPPFIITKDEDWSFNIQEFLESKGFRKIDAWPIMNFTEFDKIENRAIEGFETHFIETTEELKLWFDIVKTVLFPKKRICFNAFSKKLNHENYSFIIGYYKNEPVATGLMFTKENISGIYMIATSEKHRKKGIGSYITSELLKKSKILGANSATLQSSRIALSSYLKIGFKSIDTLYVYWMLNKLNKK